MSADTRVLVVGTTPDYVDWIHRGHPGRALFLTDPAIRKNASACPPDARSELLADLTDPDRVRKRLIAHLQRWGIQIDGVACFDDESILLASDLATHWGMPYPSAQSVRCCRDKLRSKQAWVSAGVPCARFHLIRADADESSVLDHVPCPGVLKPLTGSGSELAFLADSPSRAVDGIRMIRRELLLRRGTRMYADSPPDILAEEYLAGLEFSCDFIIEQGSARILRLAEKALWVNDPIGTVRAYVVPGTLPKGVTLSALSEMLANAAHALGLSRALCMADFIICDTDVKLLEISPRPGGDCLPHLLLQAANLDMLGLGLDFAQGKPIDIPEAPKWRRMVGLRFHARAAGRVREIDSGRLQADPRVRQICLLCKPGDMIRLPPADYDSWLLGHVIFEPSETTALESQFEELLTEVHVAVANKT